MDRNLVPVVSSESSITLTIAFQITVINRSFSLNHRLSGGAVGVSSILLILPEEEICVALLINREACPGMGQLVMDIAKSVYRNVEDIYEIN